MRVLMSVVLIGALFTGHIFGQDNLLVDPSFEKAPLGDVRPAGWGQWQPEGSKYRSTVVTDAHSGARSVLLEGEGKFTTFNTVDFRIAPGDCYLFGGWVRLEGEAAEGSVKLDLQRKDGSWLCDMSGSYFKPGKSAWHSILMVSRFEDAPEAAQFRLVFTLGGKGKLWVDDVFLAKIASPARSGLLVNGDMEISAREAVAGWQENHDVAAEVALSPVTDGVHGGKVALQIHGKGTWGSANSLRTAVRADRGHTGAAWIRVREGTARLQFTYWDGGRWLGATDSDRMTAGDWKQIVIEADMKKYEKITHLSIATVCEGPKLDVLVDDAEIREPGTLTK